MDVLRAWSVVDDDAAPEASVTRWMPSPKTGGGNGDQNVSASDNLSLAAVLDTGIDDPKTVKIAWSTINASSVTLRALV